MYVCIKKNVLKWMKDIIKYNYDREGIIKQIRYHNKYGFEFLSSQILKESFDDFNLEGREKTF